MKLKSANIYLRNLTPLDASSLFDWENNPENWEVSNTEKPFTREEIEEFVNQPQDINLNQQIRFVMCINQTNTPIGCIDLFEYELEKSVGVGILIAEKAYRNKGYATEALKLLIDYCRNELRVEHIFCNIFINNKPSIRLFENGGFKFIEERMLDGNKVNYFELKIR
ncbi:MAG: GNAT family N-acetyltransferase [Bacteroidetes bacterium]|nr:GNAT family N-acetyltransferase [Bacteroidota bacterium]